MALTQNTKNHLRTGLANTAAFDEVRDILEVAQVLSSAEAAFIDGVTAGTVSAGKAMVVDSNKDIAGARNVTLGTATSVAGKLILSGATAGTVTVQTAATAGDIAIVLPATVGSAGQQLATDGTAGTATTSWAAAGSLREFKEVLGVLNDKANEALDRVKSASVYAFKYKNEEGAITTRDFQTEYHGIMAEEYPEVMHHEGKIFNPVNAFGELVLAIQALSARLDALGA